jgi:hypothetical protein
MNFITEELIGLKADPDLLKAFVQKRVVKSLTFFTKFVSPKKKPDRRTPAETSLIDIIKVAMEQSLSLDFKSIEEPKKKLMTTATT